MSLRVQYTETDIHAEDVSVGMRIRQACAEPFIVAEISTVTTTDNGDWLKFTDANGKRRFFRPSAPIIYMFGT